MRQVNLLVRKVSEGVHTAISLNEMGNRWKIVGTPPPARSTRMVENWTSTSEVSTAKTRFSFYNSSEV